MATTTDIKNLIINKVESQTVFDYMVANGFVSEDELYLVQGEDYAVLYTAQELSDEQKAQVRTNIGLSNVEDIQQYSINNPPPYPVISVNEKTGTITLTATDVNADPEGSATQALLEAKSYADTSIAALVNAAPETLDTLGELATAFEENQEVVDALDASITNKQDKISDTLILIDTVTGLQHKIQIQNGQLVSFPVE